MLNLSRGRTPLWHKSSRLTVSHRKIPFLTTCDAMEFAETGHLREVCLNLPVSQLRVLHAKWLECEKLTELMTSFHRSCLHWSRWHSSAVAVLLDFFHHWEHPGMCDKDSHTPYPNIVCNCFCNRMGWIFWSL